MSEVNWLQIEDLFSEALERPQSERETFVKARCADNKALCDEVLAMLEMDDNPIDLIEDSIVAPDSLANFFVDKGLVDPHSLALSGASFGNYKILEKIGGGGMGAVYLGENAQGEKVAVKFIRRGMDNNFNLRRFRYEQKILAAFDHPNITRFYDVGVTETGLPFLVMEYVEGVPIFDYCRRKNLDITEKLELFRAVFGAVEYAHYHKVVHRDLKPSNILVTNEGAVKLLDFGIAKILDPKLIHETINPTATLFRPLTPDYASPEQVRGEEITTTSDVYSLGIVLYELLTGEKPYKINQSSPYEIVRAVCEQMPRLPSEILRRNKTTFWNEQILYPTDSLFFAEIDKVLLKALQKEVKKRYESVIEFDTDVEKLLAGKNVGAEISAWQTSAKNQPAAFSLSSINSLAILPFEILTADNEFSGSSDANFLGIGLADILTTRLSNLRQLAVRPTSSVLRLASKGYEIDRLGQELKVDYLLEGHILRLDNTYRVNVKLLNTNDQRILWADKFDETESNLFRLQDLIAEKVTASLVPQITGDEQKFFSEQEAVNDAAFEAYLRGRFYWHTYTYEGILKSESYFKQAIALDPEFSLAYSGLADCYNWFGVSEFKLPEECFLPAKKNALRALRLNRNSPEAYASLAFAIWAYDWDAEEAENLYRRALELNANYPRAHEWYAYLLSSENRHEEAIQSMERAEKLDPNSPSLTAMYGFLLYNARRYEEAYAKTKRSLELQPDYYLALQGLGWVCPPLEKYDIAIEGARKAVEISNLLAMNEWSLGMALAESGDLKEARKIAQNIEKRMLTEHIAPYYPAVLYSVLGEPGTAFKWLEKAVEQRGYWTRWMLAEPRLDVLRGDERYKKLAARIRPISTNETDESFAQNTELIEPKTKDRASIAAKNNFAKWLIPSLAVISIALAISLYLAIVNKTLPETVETKPAISAPQPGNTLAILPFTNENGSDNVLGSGLTDELRSNLGRFRKLSILAVSTSQGAEARDVQTLGRETSADFVLRGNLQDFGNKVLLSAELLNTKNGETMWREKFASAKNELSMLRGQISERVLNVLAIELSSSEREYIAKPYTTDNEAFQLYLAGRYQLIGRQREGFEKAIKNFARAVERDPNFALAYAGLADSYMLVNEYSEQKSPDLLRKAELYALKALSLDENLAEAHTSLAQVKSMIAESPKGNVSMEAESHFLRAIELNPSYSTARHWYGNYLFYLKRFPESLVQMQEAVRLEPRSAMMLTSLGTTYGNLKQLDKAIESYNKAIEVDKSHARAYEMKSLCQQVMDDYRGALQTFSTARLYVDSPENQLTELIMLTQALAFEGKSEEARKNLNTLLETESARIKPTPLAVEIALIYDLLDDRDQTIKWIEKIKNPYTLNQVAQDSRFKNIRNDARFALLVENSAFKAQNIPAPLTIQLA